VPCDASPARPSPADMRARVHAFSGIYIYCTSRRGGGGSLSSPVGVQRTRIQDVDAARLQGRQIAAPDAAAKAERAVGQRERREREGGGERVAERAV